VQFTSDTMSAADYQYPLSAFTDAIALHSLTSSHEQEVLAFLNRRPLHTFGLLGYIHHNSLVSPLNRGEFYACRNPQGELRGVALIGHVTLFEASSEAVIKSFAELAHTCSGIRMLLGEDSRIERFWKHYAGDCAPARTTHYDLLACGRGSMKAGRRFCNLRKAASDDLDLIVMAHARAGFEENGTNLLRADMPGFVQRCALRIERGQTWVLVEDDRLIFKADVLTYSSQVAYLEAVWVDPQERGKGYGFRCMSELSDRLLEGAASICLLVNRQNEAAQALYKKIGYGPLGSYEVIAI
jgi:uncharacterized protein